jgi:hypothetical protein
MQKFITSFVAVLILVAGIIPSHAQAYETTRQTAVRLSDDVLMYLVTYSFGHEDFSYRMPVLAKRDAESTNALSYTVLSNGKLRTSVGDTVGIVIADAPIEAGKYVVEAGEAKEFTLVTFLTLPKERSASSTNFSLTVTALPFELGTEGKYQQNRLSESELAKYQTAVISTNEKLGITTR